MTKFCYLTMKLVSRSTKQSIAQSEILFKTQLNATLSDSAVRQPIVEMNELE